MIELDLTPAARADLVAIRLHSQEQFGGRVADTYFKGFDEASPSFATIHWPEHRIRN